MASNKHTSKDIKDELYQRLRASQALYSQLEEALSTSQAILTKGFTEPLNDKEREDLC